MFSADLSWTEPDAEKVGERRERKARERSRIEESIKTTSSSKSSGSADWELWWTSGLKKARELQSSVLRPSSQSGAKSQKTTRFALKESDLQHTQGLKDQTLQPSWNYATTLSPTLPTGAPFDVLVHEVPELEGDFSSRGTTSSSTETRLSRDQVIAMDAAESHLVAVAEEKQREAQPPTRVDAWGGKTPYDMPFVSLSSDPSESLGSAVAGHDDCPSTPSPSQLNENERQLGPQIKVDTLGPDAQKLYDTSRHAPAAPGTAEAARLDSRSCPPLSQWKSLSPRGVPAEILLAPSKVAVAYSSTMELTRFQRFIRRMESAGPRIILDRLKERWQEDEKVDEELALEKQLWLLAGFQMQLPHVVPKPICATGRMLELYGNLCEVFQMSAMHPDQTVHFLTNEARRPVTLPTNVSYLTARDCSAVPLPYPEDYFSHIRASALPSLVPSSKLPEMFRECYKLLARGGVFEVRVMDAGPVRKTAGPLLRTWIEDRISTNLEKTFRCSKPCLLVPGWLIDAGFDLTDPDGSKITLPCAVDAYSEDIDEELSSIIGRSLWRDIWGGFVDEAPGEPKWFWEDDDIMQECLERHTAFECGTLLAYKR